MCLQEYFIVLCYVIGIPQVCSLPSVAPVLDWRSEPAKSTSVRREDMISFGEAAGAVSMYSVNNACERDDAALRRCEAMTCMEGAKGRRKTRRADCHELRCEAVGLSAIRGCLQPAAEIAILS